MKADLNDFETGWYGISLGLRETEIDELIVALQGMKQERTHFHFRSEFEGAGGIGDIELYFMPEDQPNNMELEASAKPLRFWPST